MDAAKIHAELTRIAQLVGPKAYVSLSISADCTADEPIYVSCYPEGVCRSHIITARGVSFEEVIRKLEAALATELDQISRNRIRKMALSIITMTADVGSCSDAGLRADGFSQDEIKRLGVRACEEATRLGDAGPFKITIAHTNGAPVFDRMEAESRA